MEALLIDQFQIRQDRFIHPLLEISRHIIVAQLADLRGKYCGRSDDADPLLVRQSPFQFLSADTPRQQTVDDACVEIVAGAYGAHCLYRYSGVPGSAVWRAHITAFG